MRRLDGIDRYEDKSNFEKMMGIFGNSFLAVVGVLGAGLGLHFALENLEQLDTAGKALYGTEILAASSLTVFAVKNVIGNFKSLFN